MELVYQAMKPLQTNKRMIIPLQLALRLTILTPRPLRLTQSFPIMLRIHRLLERIRSQRRRSSGLNQEVI